LKGVHHFYNVKAKRFMSFNTSDYLLHYISLFLYYNYLFYWYSTSVYSTCKMPHMRHENASYEARKNVLRASQPGTFFTQAYEELTMRIPSVLTAIERHTLNQSNFKQ
jgi:hypothetical protein